MTLLHPEEHTPASELTTPHHGLRRRTVQRGLCLLSVLSLIGAACGSSGSSGSSAPSGTTKAATGTASVLTIVSDQPPETLDPPVGINNQDAIGSGNMYVELTRFGTKPGPDGTTEDDPTKVLPYLAQSWVISNAGKTYTFKLKPGLKFASGTPVDGAAVKYSFERALAGTGSAFIDDDVAGLVTSISVASQYSVVIHLSEALPSVLLAWASGGTAIVDPSVVSKQPKTWLASHEAGSGPYELVSYAPNQSLVMKARPGFAAWAGWGAKSQTIRMSYVSDNSTLLLDAKTADVTLGLTNQAAASLENDSSVKVVADPSTFIEKLLLAWSKAPFNNLKVREALAYAIPYQAILDGPIEKFGQLYYGPIPPSLPFFSATAEAPLATNTAMAKSLLAQSGMSLPIHANLTVEEGNGNDQQIAELLQADLKPVGIDFKIQTLPTAQFSATTYGNGFQAELRLDAPAVDDTGYFLGYAMTCKVAGVGTNADHMCMPNADALLAQARASASTAANQKRYDQITSIWRAHYPEAPLYSVNKVTILNKAVTSWDYGTNFAVYNWAAS